MVVWWWHNHSGFSLIINGILNANGQMYKTKCLHFALSNVELLNTDIKERKRDKKQSDSKESRSLFGGTSFHPWATLYGFIQSWQPSFLHITINRSCNQKTRNVAL